MEVPMLVAFPWVSRPAGRVLVTSIAIGWALAAAPLASAQQQAPPDESGMTPSPTTP
jgi:hypothetical protein